MINSKNEFLPKVNFNEEPNDNKALEVIWDSPCPFVF